MPDDKQDQAQHSAVKSLVQHDEFQRLAPEAQRTALTHLDPSFSALHTTEQDKFIRTYGAPAPSSDIELKAGKAPMSPENLGKIEEQANKPVALPGFLGRGEEAINRNVIAPFRQGLDVIGGDLTRAAETGHTASGGGLTTPARALIGGAGALMKYGVPIGSDIRSTAAMALVPPGLSPEAREAWATERLAEYNKNVKPIMAPVVPGQEPGSLVSRVQRGHTIGTAPGAKEGELIKNILPVPETLSAVDMTREPGSETGRIGLAYTKPGETGMGHARTAFSNLADEARRQGVKTLETGPIMSQGGMGLVKSIGGERPLTMTGPLEGQFDISKPRSAPASTIRTTPFSLAPESGVKPIAPAPTPRLGYEPVAPKLSPQDAAAQVGAKHVGTMGTGADLLHLFNDPQTDSTLALPTARMTPEEITKEMEQSRALFSKAKPIGGEFEDITHEFPGATPITASAPKTSEAAKAASPTPANPEAVIPRVPTLQPKPLTGIQSPIPSQRVAAEAMNNAVSRELDNLYTRGMGDKATTLSHIIRDLTPQEIIEGKFGRPKTQEGRTVLGAGIGTSRDPYIATALERIRKATADAAKSFKPIPGKGPKRKE